MAPTAPELLECLLFIASLFHRTVIILDGLDEVPYEARENEVLPTLRILLNKSQDLNIALLIASRPEPDIKHLLRNETCLFVSTVKNSSDIEAYVRSALEKYNRLRVLEIHYKEHLVDTLVKQANGMYALRTDLCFLAIAKNHLGSDGPDVRWIICEEKRPQGR
jgi:hypothetical protein